MYVFSLIDIQSGVNIIVTSVLLPVSSFFYFLLKSLHLGSEISAHLHMYYLMQIEDTMQSQSECLVWCSP